STDAQGRQVSAAAGVDRQIFDLRTEGNAMDQDVDGAEFLAHRLHRALDGKVAVFGPAPVVAGLFIHVGHRVVADVAGQKLLYFQGAGVEGKHARRSIDV